MTPVAQRTITTSPYCFLFGLEVWTDSFRQTGTLMHIARINEIYVRRQTQEFEKTLEKLHLYVKGEKSIFYFFNVCFDFC